MLRTKGFTLIELLVVLVIVGVLIALILPNALRAIRQANTKECASNIRSIDTAVQMYYTEKRTWPSAATELTSYLAEGKVPKCPIAGTDYALITDPTGSGGKVVDRSSHFDAANWPNLHK